MHKILTAVSPMPDSFFSYRPAYEAQFSESLKAACRSDDDGDSEEAKNALHARLFDLQAQLNQVPPLTITYSCACVCVPCTVLHMRRSEHAC